MSVHFTRLELTRSRKAQELKIDNSLPEHLGIHLDFTMAGLERIRAVLGQLMVISSGYRCADLNRAVGGAPDSQHLIAQAADFTCPGYGDPHKIVAALAPMRRILGLDQLILEQGWVHVSFTLNPRYMVLESKGGRFELIS